MLLRSSWLGAPAPPQHQPLSLLHASVPIAAASGETGAVKGGRTKAGSWWQLAKATSLSPPPSLSGGAGSVAPPPALPRSPRSQAPNRSSILRVQGKRKVLLRGEAPGPRQPCHMP